MARRAELVVSTVSTTSDPWRTNLHVTPFNIGLGGVVVSGTPTYRVEHTFDDVYADNFNPATAAWFSHASLVSVVNANADGNYAFPITGIRLRLLSGTGEVRLSILQAGITQ